MRVLFSTTAGAGHFGPQVPFAKACQAAGHEVMVAAPASFASSVAAASLAHAPFADVPPDVMGAVYGRLSWVSHEEANAIVIGEIFGRLDAQAALAGVSATVEGWRPDVVIREPCEFASWVVAEKAGVPQATVAIGVAAMDEVSLPALLEPLAELRALAGVDDDPELARLAALPCLSTLPPTFDATDARGPDAIRRFRHPVHGHPQGRVPAPWGDPASPLVYVTFGSITRTVPVFAPVYGAAVEVLGDLDMRVLLTVGEGDGLPVDRVPANVHIERWWPQADVMPLASAVVGHGGFGTTMTALAGGVPQVVVPLFSTDQFLNGERVSDVGVGMCIQGGVDGIGALPDALGRVLAEPAFGESARRMAGEIAGLPDVSEAVPFLEALASA
ncbi:MAG TPA: glycosyltransferase [Acidimicrobiales bacterium]|nr:glycosyltransferase [Acidimicrobiales bacterium]